MELFRPIVNPVSDTISWPWPQLMNTKRYVMLADETTVYLLDGSWSRTKLFDCDAGGDQWEIMDFGTYLLMNNGQQIFERDPSTGVFSESSYVNTPRMESVCNFNGQLVGAGISGDWYNCDSRFAVWSNIDRIDFLPDEKNIAGYRDMQIGSIYKCLALRKGIVFYGDEGIAMLNPLERSGAFGYRMLTNHGISSRKLAGGNLDEHIAITDDYTLWHISSEGITELGFEHHLNVLDLGNLQITHDENDREIYITDGSKCFVFRGGELMERGLAPTSLISISETLYGLYNTIDESIMVGTDDLDFNLVGKKNFEFVELGIDTDGSSFVRSRLHYNTGQTMIYSPWHLVNPDGYGYIGSASNKANIEIKIENTTTCRFNFITVGYKITDNRIQNQKQTIMDRSWNGS